MSRHVTAFVVKYLITLAAVYFVALFFPLLGTMNFLYALTVALLISAVGYATDLYIPRALNYIVAVGVDFVVAALLTYWGNWYLPGMHVSGTFASLVGLLVAGCEIFYHFQFVRKSNEPVGKGGPDR